MINKLNENNLNMNNSMLTVLKGLILSIIITLVSIFVFACIVTYTDFSENTVAPIMIGITALSILIGTSFSTIKLNKNGLLSGGIIGILYMISLYILSSTMGTGFELNINAIIMMCIGITAGMIGGIIGVNVKR
mgnify:CR=1 FL=1